MENLTPNEVSIMFIAVAAAISICLGTVVGFTVALIQFIRKANKEHNGNR